MSTISRHFLFIIQWISRKWLIITSHTFNICTRISSVAFCTCCDLTGTKNWVAFREGMTWIETTAPFDWQLWLWTPKWPSHEGSTHHLNIYHVLVTIWKATDGLCIHAWRPLCTHAWRPLCIHAWRPLCTHAWRLLCTHAWMPLCTHAWRALCTHAKTGRHNLCQIPSSYETGVLVVGMITSRYNKWHI